MSGVTPFLLLSSILAFGASACGSAPKSAEVATALTETLVPEHHEIDLTCSDLDVARSSEGLRKALASGSPSEGFDAQAFGTLRAELVSGIGTLFAVLRIDTTKCAPETVLSEGLNGHEAGTFPKECQDAVGAALRQAEAAPESSPEHRIFVALKDAKFASWQAILSDPIRAARLIDLSPALVYAAIELADGAERFADDLSSNFSWGKGLIRTGLTLIAAETVAWTFDRVVDRLETTRLVSPVTIARAACGLQKGTSRGLVASRVLKRAILRTEKRQWNGRPYPMHALCETDGLKKNDTCARLTRSAFADEDPEAKTPSSIEPRLGAGFDWAKNTSEVSKSAANKIREATQLCNRRGMDACRVASG